jgi:hypothetical protein
MISHPFFLGTVLFVITIVLGIYWAVIDYDLPKDAPKWVYISFSVAWILFFIAAIAQGLGVLRL